MDAIKTGSFIAELRREKELTQRELADAMLVSDKAISRWETGRGMPDIENLEALAGALDTSVAELLRGERIEEAVEPAEANAIATEGLALADDLLRRKTRLNVAAGFLAGLIIVLLVVVHLTSPIVLHYKDVNAKVEELSDGTLIAVATSNPSGWDIEETEDGGIFLNAYTTQLDRIFNNGKKAVVTLGKATDIKYVYYYPDQGEDLLLYDARANVSGVSGGVMSLPRLVYNMWLTLALVVGVAGLVAWWLLRKRWYATHILRITLFPLCLAASIVAVLWGKFGEIYNAAYYFSGIMLLTIALYALALVVLARIQSPKTEASD